MPGFVPDSPRLNNVNDPRESGNFVIASEASNPDFFTLDCLVAEPVIGSTDRPVALAYFTSFTPVTASRF